MNWGHVNPVFFDDALPKFARIVVDILGTAALQEHVFLRDASGLLTFVLCQTIPEADEERIREAASALHPYVDQLPVATSEQLMDPSLSDLSLALRDQLDHPEFQGCVLMRERRIIGQDWLRRPVQPLPGVPTLFSFFSHKGGVGRSTALAVTANHLAQKSYNVLVVDLDLEAPGLGYMLLPEDRLPRFGALDFFVENGLHALDDAFYDDLIATSPLTNAGGRVDVVPALGRTSEASPGNVLGKLSRAYLEDVTQAQTLKSFLDQAQALIQGLCQYRSYDVVLIDTRAGLNESTAAALLGLGAHTLLFGVDTPQTFRGYRCLLQYLARFVEPEENPELESWRHRLRMVHAKASADPEEQKAFRDKAHELFAATLYEEDEGLRDPAEGILPFNFGPDAKEAPHFAWPILHDHQYLNFDPLTKQGQLKGYLYEPTFGVFLSEVLSIVEGKRAHEDTR